MILLIDNNMTGAIMYRNVNDPKRISPYDLQGISRLSSTPPSKAAFFRFPSSSESNKTQKPTESEKTAAHKESNE